MSQSDPVQPNEETEVKHEVQQQESVQNEEKQQTMTSSGLTENVAGLLCYVAWFVSGIVFLFLEKENKFVRFHALQSIFLSVIYIVLNVVLDFIPFIGGLLSLLLSPAALVLWIILMVKTYKGERFKLPIIGDLAENQMK